MYSSIAKMKVGEQQRRRGNAFIPVVQLEDVIEIGKDMNVVVNPPPIRTLSECQKRALQDRFNALQK